jgi:hypothetical protein
VSEEPDQEQRVRLDVPGENPAGQGTGPMRPVQPGSGDPQMARADRRALWIGIAALLMSLFSPFLGLIMAAVALYVAIRTVRAIRRAGSKASSAVYGIVLASIALVISIFITSFQILLWNELQSYHDCMSLANTITDESHCKDSFARSFEKKLHLPKDSFKGGFGGL